MTEKLEKVGLKQSRFDPCLFIGPDVICVVYVDNLIFWSRDLANIDKVVLELCKLGVALSKKMMQRDSLVLSLSMTSLLV